MTEQLVQYRNEMRSELDNILSWWEMMTIDRDQGGFVGSIDHDNKIHAGSPKGSVLNSRILWAYSAAYDLTKNNNYFQLADRAYRYFTDHFIDAEFGGVYWTVDATGKPLDTKKQIYALAFAVYGLSEYARVTGDATAKSMSVEIFQQIVTHSHDDADGGYIEALTRDWKDIADLRLSDHDANEKKSMNTHLHVLEAFGDLYRIWPDEELKTKLCEVIELFLDHIIDKRSGHLVLFFDETWNARSNVISYGHDIESAWLIQESAELLNDPDLLKKVKNVSVKIAEAALEGLDKDGGLWYERAGIKGDLVTQKHSWPQAEAMIGFLNAWEITGDTRFLDHSLRSWQFVKDHIHDKELGEWYWGVNADYSPMKEQEKVGIWKCPYHNSRACVEVIRRIDKFLNSGK